MGDIASTIAAGAGGEITDIANAITGNALSKNLMDYQAQKQQQLMTFSNMAQLGMWNETNYPAQVEQLEKAGLNPALLYAKGGGPAATTGSPTTGGGMPPGPHIGGSAQAMMAIEQQQQMQSAQIDLMKAQANQANAQAAKTSGVDTDVAHAQQQNILANTGNTQADTLLKEADLNLKNLETAYQSGTLNDRMNLISYNTQEALEKLKQAQIQTNLDTNTVNAKIDQIKQEAIGARLKNLYTIAQTQNTQANTQNTKTDTQLKEQQITNIQADTQKIFKQIDQISAQITQGWTNLDIQQQRTKLEGLNTLLSNFKALGIPLADWKAAQNDVEKILNMKY